MNRLHVNSYSHLPLSWARTATAEPAFATVKLPYSSPLWIPTADIPHHYSFEQVYQEQECVWPTAGRF